MTRRIILKKYFTIGAQQMLVSTITVNYREF